MLRTFALATLLLLALLWAMVPFVRDGNAPTPLQAADLPNAQTNSDSLMAAGAVITVTTTSDEVVINGDCSLREAIQAASLDAMVDQCSAGSGGDTVVVPAGHYLLASGQLTLTGVITLQGSITDTTILDANQQSRVLHIYPDAVVALLHLDIRNGHALGYCCEISTPEGGGVLNDGITRIAYSTVHNNQAGNRPGSAGESSGADGGGIYNIGNLTVTNSTISGNAASNTECMTHGGQLTCGTIGEGGGIANFGTLWLDNASVVSNTSGFNSYFWQEGESGHYGTGGGIYNMGTTLIKNSILANNRASDCRGAITSLGHNIIEKIDDCLVSGDFIQWVAYLGPLSDNGGPTRTHLLGRNSPALDAGDCTDSASRVVSVDQRGHSRPQGNGCDIGAYESPYTSTFAISTISLPQIAYNPAYNLTNDPLYDVMPSWSPDSNKIAFVRSEAEFPFFSDSAIYVMNADGSQPVQVSNHAVRPSWSPDGTRILFMSYQGNYGQVSVMAADGSSLTNLVSTTVKVEPYPLWSPDGSKILYSQEYDAINVMNVDSSQKIQLAAHGRVTASPWSPDSSKVVFQDPLAESRLPFSKVHIVNVDGSHRIDIGSDVESTDWPTWSPDSSKIAFQCITLQSSYERHICVVNSDGSNRLEVSMGENWDAVPVWSPNGDKIAFRCGADFCVMNSDGSQITKLNNVYGGFIGVPKWSPDGTKLLASRLWLNGSEFDEIFLIYADGTRQRQLNDTPSNFYISDATWSPDSRKILFVGGFDYGRGLPPGDREIYVLGVD